MTENRPQFTLPESYKELFDSFNSHMPSNESYEIVGGNGNEQLVQDVAILLNRDITSPAGLFPNDENEVKVTPNLRGRDVFVIQSMQPNPNTHLQEVVLIGDAILRSDAGKARIILPKIAYDRQDRKSESRTPISIGAVADQIASAGYHSILTVDIHAEQSMVAFHGPWDNIYGSKVLIPAIERQELQNPVVLAPDAGSVKRAEKYAQKLDADVAVVIKRRKSPDESQAIYLAGDVQNKDVVIVDDVTTTGGSIINAGIRAKEAGANRVVAAVTHSELVKDRDGLTLLDKLSQKNNPIDRFITTDTIFQSDMVRNHEKIDVVSVAPMLAVAIMCYLTGESIGRRLID